LKVTLNRPVQGNAINNNMVADLMDLVTQLRHAPDIHYVVLTGQGKFFSAGYDMADSAKNLEDISLTENHIRAHQLDGNELMRKLENIEQITICGINGITVGGGLTLGMACDFSVMDSEAWISVPEVNLGMFYAWGSTPLLIKLVGGPKAKEIIMMCDRIDANEALNIGLVNRVAPPGQLNIVIEEILSKLRQSPFPPIRVTKKIVNSIEATTMGNIGVFESEMHEQLHFSGLPTKCIVDMVQSRLKK